MEKQIPIPSTAISFVMDHFHIPTEDQAWFARADRILKMVPFLNDWVAYKGEIVFAEVDLHKSLACGRPIVGIGYCATRVLVNRRIDSCHNYSPDTFKPCHLSTFPTRYI